MTAIFLSDVHITDPDNSHGKRVRQFLTEVASQKDEIFILGDFFDSWPITSRFLLKKFDPILNQLREFVEGGKKVHYFEGNHDFNLGVLFKKELGIQVYPVPIEVNWGGKRIHISHGDLQNESEVGYRLLYSLFRQKLFQKSLKILPPEFIYHSGLKASAISRKLGLRKSTRDDEKVRKTYREIAMQNFKAGYDLVLHGHTHVPDDYRVVVDGRHCRYINTGDWVNHFTFVEYDGSEFHHKKFLN